MVFNANRVEPFSGMNHEIPDYLGMKQRLTLEQLKLWTVAVVKEKPKGNIKGGLIVKIAGHCFVCGKTGHRKFES